MGKLNPSKEGTRAFADFLTQVMQECDITQVSLASQLEEVGYQTNVYKLQRLRSAGGDPDAFLIRGLARLQLLTDANGTPYSLDDLLDITCGQLQPGEPARGHFQNEPLPYAEAIAVIRKGMNGLTEDEFAQRVEIDVPRLRKILRGLVPDFLELVRLAGNLAEPYTVEQLAVLYRSSIDESVQPPNSPDSGQSGEGDRPTSQPNQSR